MFIRHTHARLTKSAIAAVAALGLSAGLTACGDDDPTGPAGDPSQAQTALNGDVFNSADVQFATDMIPHHAQAIEMVTLTDGRELDPQVRQIAEAIRTAQAPEVETMVGWLTDWDQEVPETSLDHVNADHDDTGDHSGMDGMDGMDDEVGDSAMSSDMPGMMSRDEMTALKDASDGDFQDMWLEMMIEHHTGAIEMARAEQDSGVFADAVALAESIEAGQSNEIELMDGLLGS